MRVGKPGPGRSGRMHVSTTRTFCDLGAVSPMTLSMIACAIPGVASVLSSADMTTSATLIS
jgi:hypothetical protein